MKRIYFTLSIVLYLFCSCQNELYEILTTPAGISDFTPVIIPVCNGKDSAYCCMSGDDFYYSLNIKIVGPDDFAIQLYNHIEKDRFIEVSDSFFEELNLNHAIVKEDSIIKSIYLKGGVRDVIKTFSRNKLLPYGGINADQINYIVYLLFQNDIYCYWDDESEGLLIGVDDI